MNQQKSLLAGAILGALAVAFGAFGAHLLKPVLSSTGRLETYELAVRYEFYHAFALLLVGILQRFMNSKFLRISSFLFLTGTLFFSGSLYLLSLASSTRFVFITPIGGVLLILGWITLLLGVIRGEK